jgi:hypothetical protein
VISIAVLPTYPMDEEIIKLCMMNQLLGLGLAEHFVKETEEVLAQAYKYEKHAFSFVNQFRINIIAEYIWCVYTI